MQLKTYMRVTNVYNTKYKQINNKDCLEKYLYSDLQPTISIDSPDLKRTKVLRGA